VEARFSEEIRRGHWAPRIKMMIGIARPVPASNGLTGHDEHNHTSANHFWKKLLQFPQRVRAMFERVVRDDEIRPSIPDCGRRSNNADTLVFGFDASRLADFYSELVAAIDVGEQIPATAAEVEDSHLGTEIFGELREIRPTTKTADFGLPLEILNVVVPIRRRRRYGARCKTCHDFIPFFIFRTSVR
jgi:hypothetical protein